MSTERASTNDYTNSRGFVNAAERAAADAFVGITTGNEGARTFWIFDGMTYGSRALAIAAMKETTP